MHLDTVLELNSTTIQLPFLLKKSQHFSHKTQVSTYSNSILNFGNCVLGLTKITSVTDLFHTWYSMAHMHLDTVLELNSTAIQLPFLLKKSHFSNKKFLVYTNI